MWRDVRFRTEDQIELVGRIYAAEGARPAPGIVMCHGFGGVQSQIEHYAEFFADGGFPVLVYDHRGFGFSAGSPRQEVDPYLQISDWRSALTYAADQPEFDAAARFGVWGSSFAGGLAMVVAANDPRVRCVVAQIPNVSGHRNSLRLFTDDQRDELRRLAAADRAGRLRGEPPMTVPLFPAAPGAFAAFTLGIPAGLIERAAEASPIWRNEVTIRSLEHLIEFEPAGWAPYVSPKPLLMIVGEEDVCAFADVQLDVFAGLPEPKRLVTYPGGHFEAYGRFFQETAGPARAWFQDHLQPRAADAPKPVAAGQPPA